MLIRAKPAETLILLVGGVNPKIPHTLEHTINKSIAISIGMYGFPLSPIVSEKNPVTQLMNISITDCFLFGKILRRLTNITHSRIIKRIIPQLVSSAWLTSIPPNTGMVKTTLSAKASDISPTAHHPFQVNKLIHRR